ncbi:MAG: hypothetical protein HC905_30560 [Bacteroidales bacterium]|nr:hypothetical protein [Bacteroidales bacterium]
MRIFSLFCLPAILVCLIILPGNSELSDEMPFNNTFEPPQKGTNSSVSNIRKIAKYTAINRNFTNFHLKYKGTSLNFNNEIKSKNLKNKSWMGFKRKPSYKIMPLGNSITEGNDPGYRGYLYKKLKNNGFYVDFVGTKQSELRDGGDPDNSGYGGFITGPGPSKGDTWNPPFKGNIYDNLDEGYHILSVDCEVIILEIGINDFLTVLIAVIIQIFQEQAN